MKRFLICVLLLCVLLPSALAEGAWEKGSRVTLGHWEQDGDDANGAEPIEWLVLEVKHGEALLIAGHGLEARPYDARTAQWDGCELRYWLNDAFLNGAFGRDEKDRLCVMTLHNASGPDTMERVTLLSADEAKKYFDGGSARLCRPTARAKAQGASAWENNGACRWWLRDAADGSAGYVQYDGTVSAGGGIVSFDDVCVRPVIRVSVG